MYLHRIALVVFFVAAPLDAAETEFSYTKDAAPFLKKYCVGCHNADDAEGKLSLETFEDLQKGGKRGPALLPGDSDASRMVRMLRGTAEPKMPPADSDQPTAEEIVRFADWVNAGAKGPDGQEPPKRLLTPHIEPAAIDSPAITAVDWSRSGKFLAIARYGQVEVLNGADKRPAFSIRDLPGKVNSVRFSQDEQFLVVASGIVGLHGEASIWDTASGQRVRVFAGHRDTIYAAVLSPDNQVLATCSYDKKILLWNATSGDPIRTLTGHNGAIFDLAFNPDGRVLASASADETVKLWQVSTGIRLDTLSQPLAEQYVTRFTPDGKYVVAGGADYRIRVWRLVSIDKPRINPLVYARFAHDAAIVQLAFSPDGATLVSTAEDRTVKLWDSKSYSQFEAFEDQSDIPAAVAVSPIDAEILVGRLDGTLDYVKLPKKSALNSTDDTRDAHVIPSDAPTTEFAESEPNDGIDQAPQLALPALVRGTIQTANQQADVDTYAFSAKASEQWVMEIKAARMKSPLDSKIEVLDADGRPIPRVLLQAVRDSYFTFRGKDSNTSDDFRVHNWEEMELNEFLYANGEVVKLWLYPRGPDSGFKVYPGTGKRYTYFDTTPLAHPLHEPCYIVEPHAPNSTLIPNGLPVFPIYFENDADSRRKFGSDSRLTFTAPEDGSYRVRVSDARGFGGESYKYELSIRPRRPDFRVTLQGGNPTVNAGSGKEFSVRVDRLDDFEGEIRVDIVSVPAGFTVTSPILIEAGQDIAYGAIYAAPDAPAPDAETAKATKVTATATIFRQRVTKDVNNLGEIKLAAAPKLLVRLEPSELTLSPGQTISAKVVLERRGFGGNVSFGKEDSGRNLPHGVYVDNIGLNGLLLFGNQNEREIFITASKIVPAQTRTFHLRANAEGNQVSTPVTLTITK